MATSTAVHSNAFNFASFVKSGVDPRTGLYTVSLSLPEVQTCDLGGPKLPLTLNFNPLNTDDSGFGKGWELKLTQYAPHNQIISLSSGQTHKVTGPYPGVPGRLRMKEQKIEDFQLFEQPDKTFKVVHKSGLIEILALKGASPQMAVPVKMYSAQGHEVTLDYVTVNGFPMLSAIQDSVGVVLRVTRDTVTKKVTFAMSITNGVPAAQVILDLKDDRVHRVTLPTTEGAGWLFEYETHKSLACISKVSTPLGAVETVRYNDEGHGIPGAGNAQRKLPRVTEHITQLGSGQASLHVKYTYGSDGHNFLGYGASVDYVHDGYDNLFKVLQPYEYTTTESLVVAATTVRSVTRTFNRFHLQVLEDTLQGNHRKTVRTRYYADDNDKLSYDAQPRQCQLPRRASTMWSLSDDPRYWRNDVEISEFDIHGNQTLRVEPNGITERIEYFPAEGEPALCPADPYGFVRHVREKTVAPASDLSLIPDIQPGARPLRTRFRYEAQPPLSSSPIVTPWISLVQERLFELLDTVSGSRSKIADPTEQQLSLTVYSYFNTPTNLLTHGRRSRQAITMGTDGGPTTFIAYTYTKIAANHSLRTEQRSSTDFDDSTLTVIDERSVLNGEPLLVTHNGVEHTYRYDTLNRVIRETQAPGTAYEASRIFRYRLLRPVDPGQTPPALQAYQELEDVKGVKTRTHFDALSRAVREELQDVDHSGGAWRDIYTARYNEKGLLVEETEIDWLKTTDLPLKTSYTYDLWGLQDSMTRPDGVTLHTLNQLHLFTTEQWIDGQARTRTLTNRFEKTLSVERLDVDDRVISQQSFKYDGWGNCTQKTDELGRITCYRYDAFTRLLSTILPDLTIVDNSYAGHSTAALNTALRVTPGNSQLPSIELGQQRFDGLDRVTQVTIGSRTEKLEYEAGQFQPRRKTTPAGNQFDYQYKRGLTSIPTVITTPEEQSTYDVDVLDAQLNGSKNSEGEYSFTYDQTGQLTVESWTDSIDKKTYTTRYSSSLKGRGLSRTDIGGHNTISTYDPRNGRLLSIEQRQLRASFDYDAIGRLYRTTTTDKGSGNTLTTTLEFDELGREKRRTLVLLDKLDQPIAAERSIELTYLADSNVSTRHLRVAGITALLETYRYDLRARLERYGCSGTDLPRDRYGNAITSQYFEYDVLDNVIYSRTVFNDGRVDVAHFSFSADDPDQLVGARHSHPDYQGLQTDFKYDADGNLLEDELGQQLGYDSKSRLMTVKTSTGQSLTAYRYDAHDHLQSVKDEGNSQTLRFYQGTRITDTLHDDRHLQFFYHGGNPVGQQTPGDDAQMLLVLTDAKQSVIAENQGSEVRSTVYSAYGERDRATSMKSLLAFNGEAVETAGWYLLGNGYRAYNPSLGRFHSPDSMAVFGPGGLNRYMYCAGNPIAFSDPSGHRRQSRIINNVAFNVGVAVAVTFMGIVISLVTLNPAPLVAALKVVGVQITATTISMVASAVTWGATALSIGVETARTFVRDEKVSEALGWVGLGLDAVALPNVRLPKPVTPRSSIGSIASTASDSPSVSTQSSRSQTTPMRTRANAAPGRLETSPRRASVLRSEVNVADTPPFKLGDELLKQAWRNENAVVVFYEASGPTFVRETITTSFIETTETLIPPPTKLQKMLNRDTAALQENIVLDGVEWWKFRKSGTPDKPIPKLRS